MIYDQVNRYFDKYGDPRSKNYIIGSTIWMPLGIITCYVLFVKIIGPWYMKNRKAYNIKKWVMAYDAIQIIANSYLVIKVLQVVTSTRRSLFCMEFDFSDSAQSADDYWISHLYYLIKIVDGMDTVFCVLRKSYRQITFLHVYHHSLMILAGWIGMKFVPGGQSIYFGAGNSLVHAVMYSYYLLAAYDIRFRNNLRFKKFVTQLQMVQFMVLSFLFLSTFTESCNYPRGVAFLVVTQCFYFTYLFGKFYYKTYIERDKKD